MKTFALGFFCGVVLITSAAFFYLSEKIDAS
jgi:hypothetical protein